MQGYVMDNWYVMNNFVSYRELTKLTGWHFYLLLRRIGNLQNIKPFLQFKCFKGHDYVNLDNHTLLRSHSKLCVVK